MASQSYEAQQRTVRLLDEQFFGGSADRERIAEVLPALTIAIRADQANAETANGQQLTIVLALLLARMGISVDLDLPDVPLLRPQPPFREGRLASAIEEIGSDLIPGVKVTAGLEDPVMAFVFGDTPSSRGSVPELRVTADDWTLQVSEAVDSEASRISGTLPFGALAAAPTAAAEALRVVLPILAERIERPLVANAHRLDVGQKICLDLRDYFLDLPTIQAELGEFDAVSGGAINSSALYVLQAAGGVGEARVIEDDVLEASNLNRYFYSRRSELDVVKVRHLAAQSTPQLQISGIQERYTEDSVDLVGPLSSKVLVGVDHVPSRWLVQEQAPDYIAVGSTQNLTALISSHSLGEACARCLHPTPLEDDGEAATLSFVSFWAGLLLALELICHVDGRRPTMQSLYCQPFAYDGPLLMRMPVAAQASCPISSCGSSDQLAA